MKFLKLPAVLVSVVLMSGCQSQQDFGRVVGGIAGAGIGSQFGKGRGNTVNTVAGALIGSYIGEQIGKDIDAKNREKIAQVLETKPSGNQVAWKDPDTHQSFVLVPKPSFKRAKRICRPFSLVVYMNNQQYVKNGIACRNRYGQWEVVE
ncbi:MAG: glycine zipper 2TM domain-containing protein [Pseudomonadota bacterium]|nr:glycine zipper 2TM domain-containing protein [Pseudomonadota bacterium]